MSKRVSSKRKAQECAELSEDVDSWDTQDSTPSEYDCGCDERIVPDSDPAQGCHCPICDLTLGDSRELNIRTHIRSGRHVAACKRKEAAQQAQQQQTQQQNVQPVAPPPKKPKTTTLWRWIKGSSNLQQTTADNDGMARQQQCPQSAAAGLESPSAAVAAETPAAAAAAAAAAADVNGLAAAAAATEQGESECDSLQIVGEPTARIEPQQQLLQSQLNRPCQYFRPDLPGPLLLHWPLQLALDKHIPSVYSLTDSGLKSSQCTGAAEAGSHCCANCSSLANREDIQLMAQRANDAQEVLAAEDSTEHLEDALEMLAEGPAAVTSVELDGKQVAKSTVVHLLLNSRDAKSMDRLRRVQDISRTISSFSSSAEYRKHAVLNQLDPIAAVLLSGGVPALAVIQVNKLEVPSQSNRGCLSVPNLTDEQMQQQRVKIHGHVMMCDFKAAPDPVSDAADASGTPAEAAATADATAIAKQGWLLWKQGTQGPAVTVSANHAMLLNPDVVTAAGNTRTLQFGVEDLQVVLDNKLTELEASSNNSDSSTNALGLTPLHVMPSFPYVGTDGYILTKGEPAATSAATGGKPSKPGTEVVRCTVAGCSVSLALKDMRQHVGAHVLSGDVEVEHGRQLCGFCGQLVDATCCQPRLEIKSKITKVSAAGCPCFYSSMSYKAAAKSSANAPCSNVPIQCELCKDAGHEMYVWKYHMLDHMLHSHGSAAVGQQQLSAYAVSLDEFQKVLSKQQRSWVSRQRELRLSKQVAVDNNQEFSAFWRCVAS